MHKERQILFSPSMVMANLDGIKTITRRTSELTAINLNPDLWEKASDFSVDKNGCLIIKMHHKHAMLPIAVKCPYGQPGDILWQRENLIRVSDYQWCYMSDMNMVELPDINTLTPTDVSDAVKALLSKPINFCPNIHMPKIVARVWMEVEQIRLERLQDITDQEALCEGIREVTKDGKLYKYCVYDKGDYSSVPWQDMPRTPREAYFNLWNSISHAESDPNPWVWVVKYKVISTTGKPAAL